ncbi:MAG: cysteine-rich CWC family protein [Pyrinomonadaceae bacterium]
MTLTKQKCCSNCGASFTCGLESEQPCWCEDLPHIPLPANKDQDCLCPKCLWALVQETTGTTDSEPDHVESTEVPVTKKRFRLQGFAG